MIRLFPYQKIGVDFLSQRRFALLADEMGLGKTAQAILGAKAVNAKNILVICPASARINWQREFWKFGKDNSTIALSASSSFYNWGRVIMSFDHATRYVNLYKQIDWDLIIVDETHFLKEPTAKRTKAVFGIEGLLHHTKRMWLLSGTPAPNHAGEIWIMLYTFGLTKLSYNGFTARYCNSHHVGGSRYSRIQITGSNTKHTPELKEILKKFMIRRFKKDVLPDLPPIFHSIHYIQDDGKDPFDRLPHLRDKLQGELDRLKEALDFDMGAVSNEKLLATLKIMSQSVSSLRRYHGLKKIVPIAELVKQELDLALYDKIVIFGIHTDVLESLKSLLHKFNPVAITGKVLMYKRQQAVDTFQKDPLCKIFMGNIQAAGVALTLHAANQGLFIEQDWVPGNNAQASMRIHRIGQTKPVTIRHACIADSFDDRVTQILTRKIQELQTFL